MKKLLLIALLSLSFNANALTMNPDITPNLDYSCTLPFPPEEVVAVYFEYRSSGSSSWVVGGSTSAPAVCNFVFDMTTIADGNYVFRSFYQYVNREVSPYSELTSVLVERKIDLPPISDVVLTPK